MIPGKGVHYLTVTLRKIQGKLFKQLSLLIIINPHCNPKNNLQRPKTNAFLINKYEPTVPIKMFILLVP